MNPVISARSSGPAMSANSPRQAADAGPVHSHDPANADSSTNPKGSGNKKGRPASIIAPLGWVHATLLFSGFYPMMASFARLSGSDMRFYSLLCCLLPIPVVAGYFLSRKVKSLPLFIALGTAISVLFGMASGSAWQWHAQGAAGRGTPLFGAAASPLLAAIPAGIISAALFAIRANARIKGGKMKKSYEDSLAASEQESGYGGIGGIRTTAPGITEPSGNAKAGSGSHSGITESDGNGAGSGSGDGQNPVLPDEASLLDLPHPAHWLVFIGHYLLGVALKSPFYWRASFFLLAADVFVCFASQFANGFRRFVIAHAATANLPVSTMRKVSGVLLSLSMLILLLFVLPSILYGREPLTEVTLKKAAPASGRQELMPEPPQEAGLAEIIDRMDYVAAIPPVWLEYAYKAILFLACAGAAAGLLLSIYRACKRASSFFSEETGDEISFLGNDARDSMRSLGRSRRAGGAETSASRQVRKIYKRAIKKSLKETPAGTETPSALEEKAGLKEGDGIRDALHESYERARYSENGCDADDARRLRGLLKRGAR